MSENQEAARAELAKLLAGDILAGLNDAVEERLPLDNTGVVLNAALDACRDKEVAIRQAHEMGNMRLVFHNVRTLLWERQHSVYASAGERAFLEEVLDVLHGKKP